MPSYRLAQLTDQQFRQIEALENNLGLTLIAWEPVLGSESGPTSSTAGQTQSFTGATGDSFRNQR